jgi:hypothetical protein
LKVLIIGGYGTFGFGMAERLSDEAELELVLAGRSLEKAKIACAKLSGEATFTPLKLDRNAMVLDFQPDLIVDASGPFQAYSGSPVVEYCLKHGITYADISDDGAFVAAVMDQSEAAKNAGVALISGLSTCPVLSAIGLREIEKLIGPATNVTIGIAPSPKAELGRNVVAAVANYAGQDKVSILRDGQIMKGKGLTEVRHETICVPGAIPLPRLPFALADAPDAIVLSQDFGDLQNIWTGAGTRPIWLHRLLVALSRGVARGIVPKLTTFADIFHLARGWFRFGAHRGGMVVRASNAKGEVSWHLVAEGDHGPRIPALPVVALIRQMMNNDAGPMTGAYAGHQIIGLTDLSPEFEKLDIAYGLQFDGQSLPVYEQVLGAAHSGLHPAIIDMHDTGEGRVFSGECRVTRGKNPLSHIVAMVVGFPKSGQNVPVSVTVIPTKGGEKWTRNFDGKTFSSHHSLGRKRWARHVTERFGPMAIHMAILEEDGNLRIETQGWSIFGLPLPRFLRPGGDVFETQDPQGRFVFHVDLKAPLFGRLCKYEGWLTPDA